MGVKPIFWEGNLGSAQSGDEYSRGVWHDCPLVAIRAGNERGIVYEDDFVELPTTPPTTEGAFGRYSVFTSTGGAFAVATGGHGWKLSSDGDNEGASFRQKVTPFQIGRAYKQLWFEAQVKTEVITDSKNGFFLGLIEDAALTATVPIAADGTLADQNLVGFHKLEADGDAVDTVYKANGVTAVTVGADAAALVADTYINLGMRYEPGSDSSIHDPASSGITKFNLTFYANGLRLASYKQIPSADGTDFPNDVKLGFVFAVLNATGSTPGSNSIRRARCVQLLA